MGLLSLNLPVIGQSSATEDQKVRDALAAIQTDYNGNLTDANISATAGIQGSKLASGATGLAQGSFAAFRTAAVSLAANAIVVFDTEEFDVSSWFDTTTGAFTPQVAGYFSLAASVASFANLTADVFWRADLYKNGTRIKNGMPGYQRGTGVPVASIGSWIVQANGTTDAFTIGIAHGVGAATAIRNNADGTYFMGSLIGRS